MNLFRSIKWQLLVWQTVLLATVLAVLMTLHYQFHKRNLIAAVDAHLQETLLAVMPILAPPKQGVAQALPAHRPPLQERPRQEGPEQLAARILEDLEQQHIYIVSRGHRGTTQYGQVPESLSEQLPAAVSKPTQITRNGNRERIHPHHDSLIVIGTPLDEVNDEMAAVLGILLLIGGTVLVIGIAVGWLIVSRALRPIKTISETAKTIASGDHHKRIELADAPEELASMAHTLNNSFDHLDAIIETHRRFSADASHELRTPIAVVIAQTETALKRERSPAEYRTVLQACLRAGQRMKNMAESLLTLTRIDSHGAALDITACDLNSVVTNAVDSASLLSAKHPVNLQCPESPLTAPVDRDRIHQAIMNLTTNAIQHNPKGCPIHISLHKKNNRAFIEVADEGTGIPEEHLPHIFERFYRVDTSRSRECGGAGLGLSIVKGLVEAHGGTIEVSSSSGLGTVFTITLPLT